MAFQTTYPGFIYGNIQELKDGRICFSGRIDLRNQNISKLAEVLLTGDDGSTVNSDVPNKLRKSKLVRPEDLGEQIHITATSTYELYHLLLNHPVFIENVWQDDVLALKEVFLDPAIIFGDISYYSSLEKIAEKLVSDVNALSTKRGSLYAEIYPSTSEQSTDPSRNYLHGEDKIRRLEKETGGSIDEMIWGLDPFCRYEYGTYGQYGVILDRSVIRPIVDGKRGDFKVICKEGTLISGQYDGHFSLCTLIPHTGESKTLTLSGRPEQVFSDAMLSEKRHVDRNSYNP